MCYIEYVDIDLFLPYMPKARKIILSLNIKKSTISNINNKKPIIIEFNSITEANKELGIDISVLHTILSENREVEGILAIVEGNMGFVDNELNKRKTPAEKKLEMQEHLQKVANYCKKHKVNYVKNLDKCPLCKLDEAKKNFKML